jgi:hypothetical protein
LTARYRTGLCFRAFNLRTNDRLFTDFTVARFRFRTNGLGRARWLGTRRGFLARLAFALFVFRTGYSGAVNLGALGTVFFGYLLLKLNFSSLQLVLNLD